MPIYVYRCIKCEHEFELIRSIKETEAPECPKCSSKEVQKQITAANFALKGSGWAKDKYGK